MENTRAAPAIRLLLTLSALGLALPAGAWYPFAARYEAWQQDRPITMAAWHSSVPRDHLDQRVARFKDGGLNTFFWIKPVRAAHFFEAAAAGGLEWQCGMRADWEAIPGVLEIPGCSAIIVEDEPSIRNKSEQEQREAYAHIAERIEWVHANYPALLAYCNLSISKIDLDRYLRTCKPDVFSFDMYPLLRDGTTADSYLYYVNMGRETARKHRLPFWMCLQAFGRTHEKPGYAYRLPGEADMRFLVFTFLAHGGIGMHFFMYDQHEEAMITGSASGRYDDSAVSQSYLAVRDLAPEVQHLGRALLNLRSKGDVMYAGPVPEGCRPFKPVPPVLDVEAVGEPEAPALVSFFDDAAGGDYFMVVNTKHGKDLSKTDAAATIQLTLGEEVEGIERLDRQTGQVETLATTPTEDGACRVLEIQIEGGTGDLLRVQDGKPWDLRP